MGPTYIETPYITMYTETSFILAATLVPRILRHPMMKDVTQNIFNKTDVISSFVKHYLNKLV